MAGGSSWPWPLDGLPPESADSAGGVLGFGRGPALDRPRTGLAPAAGQPLADPAPPADPFDPLPFGRGGRSRGGATRPLALSASVTFLARADPAPLAPVTTRREPELTSPSPSAGGGASGRSREA